MWEEAELMQVLEGDEAGEWNLEWEKIEEIRNRLEQVW